MASDKNKHEVVIMGKAIGVKCNRILGARIDNELIERVFVSNNNQNYVEAIIEKIPYNMFKVVELVIKQAEQDLNTKFKDAIYLALVDHIYFSYKTIGLTCNLLTLALLCKSFRYAGENIQCC